MSRLLTFRVVYSDKRKLQILTFSALKRIALWVSVVLMLRLKLDKLIEVTLFSIRHFEKEIRNKTKANMSY